MSICQQLRLLLPLLVLVAAAADGKSITASQRELRQANHNRVVLELPTINFTRIYNEGPLINFSRLYNRLFNSTKEKQEDNNLNKEKEAAAAQRQLLNVAYPLNAIYDPISDRQLSSGQVLNLQIPNQANGQQLFGSFGGFSYGGAGAGAAAGLGFGTGTGHGYGFTFPGYPQIYGPSDYNNVPNVQVFQQPDFGFGSSSNYLITNNNGNGQVNDALAPYRQWLQQQQLFNRPPPPPPLPLAYDGGLDYDEEGDDYENDFEHSNVYESGDDEDEYDLDEYDDYDDGYGDGYGEGDELWRQANGDLKFKRKKNQSKKIKKSKSKSGKKKSKR